MPIPYQVHEQVRLPFFITYACTYVRMTIVQNPQRSCNLFAWVHLKIHWFTNCTGQILNCIYDSDRLRLNESAIFGENALTTTVQIAFSFALCDFPVAMQQEKVSMYPNSISIYAITLLTCYS